MLKAYLSVLPKKAPPVEDERRKSSPAFHTVLCGVILFLVSYSVDPIFAETTQERILVNHLGFLPWGAKFCMLAGTSAADFQVVEQNTGRPVFTGRMLPKEGDLGQYVIGDFSALDQPGTYLIRAGEERSGEFKIAENVYQEAIRKSVRYFSIQRCGPSTTGYNAPCHVDDGRRRDTRKYQDVSGGWHDACDVRKWVDATLYGMIGLSRVAEVLRPDWDKGGLVEELRWGNRYFLKMQEPAGYVMNHIGDVFYHGDQNRWTVNIPNTWDDRLIQTGPTNPIGQFCFIMAQAAVDRLTRKADPVYADSCRQAALRCLHWCRKEKLGSSPNELGAAVAACTGLYRTLGDKKYRDLAAGYAGLLLDLQATGPIDSRDPVRGFFFSSRGSSEPFRDIYNGCWHLMGLCELVELFPDHPDAARWRSGIELYCREYLARMTERNLFGIVPYGLYTGDPGGGRRIGYYWYRWFMEIDRPWWVGINANLASAGVGLIKASRLLKDKRLIALSQRQLDWILGVNAFNSSTVIGVGRNNPAHYDVSYWFNPGTPVIPGAVMNGIGGTSWDLPDQKPGEWETCEYWTPMVCYTMWLMSELTVGKGAAD
ncbi:MAG TPA: glycoside hydrolase family 9 protein [archaeon]|nr:glycoside hydrolase family 9 protein [archaeon]